MDRHISLGISVEESTTQIAAFASPRDRDPIDTVTLPTTNCFGVDIKSIVQEIVDLRDLFLSEIMGIGLTLPGPLNPTATKLLGDENLTDWVGRPLRSTLKRAFPGTPVALGSDAQGRALAEAIANPRLKDKAFILLSMEDSLEAARVVWTGGQPHAHHLEWSLFDTERKFEAQAPKIIDLHWFEEILPWLAPGIHAVLKAYPARPIVLAGDIMSRTPSLTARLNQALAGPNRSIYLPALPEVIQPYSSHMGATVGAVRLLFNEGLKV